MKFRFGKVLDSIIDGFRQSDAWDEEEYGKWLDRQSIGEHEATIRLAAEPDYYTYAKSLLGTREMPGPGSNPAIIAMIRQWMPSAGDDSVISWCGAFVAHCLTKYGYPVAEHPLVARSWMGPFNKVAPPREGDIVVLWRESRSSWKGHVAFFHHQEGDMLHLLGGNQSNAVSIQPYPASRLLGFYRPTKD